VYHAGVSTSFDAGTSAATETVVDGADTPEAARTLERGAPIGRYSVLERLGSGGMGVVYAAYDPDLDRQVALKLLRSDTGGEERRVRLLREAQSLARLSHPNVIAVHDVGTWEGRVFVAMEFVQGQTLGGWMRSERRALEATMRVFVAAGRGLAAVHAVGLVHRDFKPDNVMVGPEDRVRVMDFGLARGTGDDEDPVRAGGDADDLESTAPGSSSAETPVASDEARSALQTPLTVTGAVLGTPAYMAPEQHLGQSADARSDQFSFCVSLWEALYGSRPFAGSDRVSLAVHVTQGVLNEVPRDVRVPARIHAAITRGLSADPNLRFPSMDALIRAIAVDAASARRRRIAAIGFVGALGLGAGVSSMWGAASPPANPCATSVSDWSAAWSTSRREGLVRAVEAVDASYAEDVARRLAAGFDGWGGDWKAERRDACEDTRVRGQQSEERMDQRMDCLDRQLSDVSALLGQFESADTALLERSPRIMAQLPDPRLCSNPQELAQAAGPPPPRVAERVAQARARLSQSKAQYVAGRYAASVESARSIRSAIEDIEYPALRVEADKHRGDAEAKAANYDDALQALDAAFTAGWAASLDALAVESLISWIYVRGVRKGDLDAVADREALAAASVERLGSQRLAAQLANVRGALAQRRGDPKTSLAYHERALELRQSIHGERHPMVATAWNNLGTSRDESGDHDGALAAYRIALGIWEERAGPEHPLVAASQHNIGSALNGQRKFRPALEHFAIAARIRERALGPDHPSLAMTRVGQANARAELGELAEARDAYDATLRIFEHRLGPEHTNVAAVLNNRANIEHMMGHFDAALRDYDRAMKIRVAAAGGNERTLGGASALNNIAGVHRSRGRWAEALAADRGALGIQSELEPEDSLELSFSTAGIARTLLSTGRIDEASQMLARTRRSIQKHLGDDHEMMAYVLEGEAEVAWRRGQLTAAREQIQTAVALRERAGTRPDEQADARFLEARILWAAGEETAARVSARAGLAGLVGTDYDPAHAARLNEWMSAHPE
jgi:tetratricopeptide (TPR) repeat protein/predicted Ser/Thr protein kinase